MEKKHSSSKQKDSLLLLSCEFCNSKSAVLYCRADCAKLCLLCDLQVHSANALSLKHSRSPICDRCKAQPASNHFQRDDLFLCRDCDWDLYDNNTSVSSLHNRIPVKEFVGCLPALELASLFGLAWKPEFLSNSALGSLLYDQKEVTLQDVLVPSCDFSGCLRSGNCRKEVFEQLMEIAKKEKMSVDGNGAELAPETPPSRCVEKGLIESLELENGDEGELLCPRIPFTSLLMLPNLEDVRKGDCGEAEGDFLWDYDSGYQAAVQTWNYELGRSRDCGEAGALEAGCDSQDGLLIRSYSNFSKEAASITRKLLEDAYPMNCSTEREDILSRNSCSNQQLLKHAPTTEGSYNTPLAGPSSESRPTEPETGSSTRYSQATEERPHLALTETAYRLKTKVDMELFAQNRGNAMLRYKEKKKNRRFDKRIRYESRKARADTRMRVKGRFVRASENC